MSTQAHPGNDDLDRTDELPRLDVAAYEASLNQHEEIATTDTWLVESLRAQNAAAEERSEDDAVALPTLHDNGPDTGDLTLGAGRIFERIAQLESELAAAQARNVELAARADTQATELAQRAREMLAANAEVARLTELRSLTQERLLSVETAQREYHEQAQSDLASLRRSRDEERESAALRGREYEQRVGELQASLTALQEALQDTQAELRGAAELAQERTALADRLEQRIEEEERNNAQLARQLAAKLAELATNNSVLERRDATIRSLSTVRDELNEQLQHSRAHGETLAAELASAHDAISASRAGELDSRDAIAMRDARLEQLHSELAAVTAHAAAARAERDALQNALTAEQAEHERARQASLAQHATIEVLQHEGDDLKKTLTAVRAELSAANGTVDDYRARVAELEGNVAQARQAQDASEASLTEAHARIGQLEQEIAQLPNLRTEIATRIADLRAAHAALQERETELHSVRDETVQLSGSLRDTTEELALVRAQLEQQQPEILELEQALEARDQLLDRLRQELQTAQDERAIMAGQLQKSRLRNKTLAREVFDRDSRIGALKEDLAVHVEALAAIRQGISRVGGMDAPRPADEAEHVLEPVDHAGEPIVLDRKIMTLGRTMDNDACIPSKLVSRHHARLLIGPTGVIVEDAGSTNGCFVNDREVKQQLMHDGDVLGLGDLRYRLRTRSRQATRTRDNVIPFGDLRPATD